MIVQPKEWGDGDLCALPPMPDHALMIECQAIGPPSAVGRTVYLYVSPEQVIRLLGECRATAIAARSKPLSDSDSGGSGTSL